MKNMCYIIREVKEDIREVKNVADINPPLRASVEGKI